MPLLLSLSMPGTRELFGYGVVALSAIFFVVDPIAVVPVFITITEGDSAHKRKQMALRACIVTAGILLTFLIAGGLIFKLFSLTLAAFRIAGGLLLSLTGLDMLRSVTSATKTSDKEVTEAVKNPMWRSSLWPCRFWWAGFDCDGDGAGRAGQTLLAGGDFGRRDRDHRGGFVSMLRAASLVNRIWARRGGRSRTCDGLCLWPSPQFIIGGVRDAFPEILSVDRSFFRKCFSPRLLSPRT